MGACDSQPVQSQPDTQETPVIIGRTNKVTGHKVVVVGTSAVGKSSILMRYISNSFTENTVPTLAAAFFKRVVCVDGNDVTLHIWDTSGDEKYLSIAPSYYRNAVLGVFVYDVSQPSTLEDLKKWAHDFQTYSMANSRMVVLGNKCDLEPERVLVSSDAGEAFATGECHAARLF
eukprot:INCI4023.1.p1 GENE.INCI4023.1~~INCI4023.1.p1  ORF type:complete len:174 (+),score=29.35 INCI4023.1:154-675(+)